MLRCDLSIAVVNLVKTLSIQLSQCCYVLQKHCYVLQKHCYVLQEQGAPLHLVFGSSGKTPSPNQIL